MTTHLGGRVSILVVEDNASDAELTVDGLERASGAVDVKVVGDGRDALEYMRGGHGRERPWRPDLVLLDLNMPRKGGLETLQALKDDEHLRAVPVVVLTTSRSPREINCCYQSGAAAVLNKPMRLADYRQMFEAFEHFWLRHVLLPRDAS